VVHLATLFVTRQKASMTLCSGYETETVCKEVVVAQFKVLSRDLLDVFQEDNEKL
jgi:hypothetical protein